jgi:hypothetical protein
MQLVIQFKTSHVVESQCLKFEILKTVLFKIKWLKSCCYNSHGVLYVGHIYNLYVDAFVALTMSSLRVAHELKHVGAG